MQGYTCCPETVRPDVAIRTQTHREFVQLSYVATFCVSEAARLVTPAFSTPSLVQMGIHAPPGDTGTSSTILRI
jgi:hypothetical protein